MNNHLDLIATQLTFVFLVGVDGVLFYLLPRLTRPDLYFAITVPPGFRDGAEGVDILRRYRREVWIHSLIALALILLSARGRLALALLQVGVFWQLLGCFVAYLRARSRVMPHSVAPATLREADLAPRQARLPGGWAFQLGPFAILAAVALWLHSHWEQIPERFPVHWGIDGKPNGWATRSFSGVYGPLIVAACVCAGVALLAYGVSRWTRRIQVRGGPGQSERRFQHIRLSVLLETEYFLALLFAWVGSLALRSQAQMPSPLTVIVPALAFTVLVMVVMVRTGQGGSRLPEYRSLSPPSVAAPVGDRTLDRYWIVGIFYVNRSDPAIIVEKRFGLGYTLNFGQPVSWIVIGLLVVVPLALILLLRPH
jgi:uncharacterized membrane protein